MNIFENREKRGELLCVNCMRKAGTKGPNDVYTLTNVRLLKVWPQSYLSTCRGAKPNKKKHGHIFHVKSYITTLRRRPERVIVNYTDSKKQRLNRSCNQYNMEPKLLFDHGIEQYVNEVTKNVEVRES